MSVESLLTRPSTITLVVDGTVDEYGNPTGEDTTTTATVCYLEAWTTSTAGGEEATVDRHTTSDEWRYVVAAGTPITSVARITVDGEDGTFEVFGEPVNVWNPRTAAVSHIEARIYRSQR